MKTDAENDQSGLGLFFLFFSPALCKGKNGDSVVSTNSKWLWKESFMVLKLFRLLDLLNKMSCVLFSHASEIKNVNGSI